MPTRKTTRKFYEHEGLHKRRYDADKFWKRRYHKKRMKKVLKILMNSLRDGDVFLDVGCGTGEYLALSKRQFKLYAFGLDISSAYLRRSKKMGDDLVMADINFLPLRGGSVDTILCSEVLEHVERMEKAIGELFRVAKKCIIITTPSYGILRVFARALRIDLKEMNRKVGHIHILPLGQLLEKTTSEGWEIKKGGTWHITPPPTKAPAIFAPIINVFESIMDSLLPQLGNVSVVVCKAKEH